MFTLVREGRKVAATCSQCGCRLQQMEDGHWKHFGLDLYKDARGCECPNTALIGSPFQNEIIFTRWSCSNCI